MNAQKTTLILLLLSLFSFGKNKSYHNDFIVEYNNNSKTEFLIDEFNSNYELCLNSDIELNNYMPISYIYDGITWLPSNPIGISTALDDVIIDAGSTVINSNLICNNLTISSSSSLSISGSISVTATNVTIEAAASLTIGSGVTLNATTIDLNSTSTAYSSIINNGTIIGVTNYHRYTAQIAPVGTNDLISSPLANQLFEPFALLNPNLAASGLIRAFAPYNTAMESYQNYNIVSNALTSIDSGMGYRAATTDGGTLTFTGNVRSDDVTGVGLTSSGDGWNLIGNPYPSYLDFATFFTLNKNQLEGTSYQAIYGYDGNASDGWTVWNQATIDSPIETELLAPGQAFFVKSKVGGGSIDFTTNMRTTGSSDDFIAGRNATQSPHYGYLKLRSSASGGSVYFTDIYLNSNTSNAFDAGYDAMIYGGEAPNFSIYSKLVEGNDPVKLAVQAINPNDMYQVMIPLGLNANQGEELTIEISQTDLPAEIEVYIDDIENSTSTLINTNSFVFTPNNNLNGTGRFYLRFANNTLSTIDDNREVFNVYTDYLNEKVSIIGHFTNDTDAYIYDVNGRLVKSQSINRNQTNNDYSINVSSLTSGVYILKLSDKNGIKLSKKLLLK